MKTNQLIIICFISQMAFSQNNNKSGEYLNFHQETFAQNVKLRYVSREEEGKLLAEAAKRRGELSIDEEYEARVAFSNKPNKTQVEKDFLEYSVNKYAIEAQQKAMQKAFEEQEQKLKNKEEDLIRREMELKNTLKISVLLISSSLLIIIFFLEKRFRRKVKI